MRRKGLISKVIIITVLIGLFVIGYYYSPANTERELARKIELQKENEPNLLTQAKPAFESELALIVPESMRQEIENYGDSFQVKYAQDLLHNHDFDGYSFSRVFRVKNDSKEEIENQIRVYAEKNGYVFDENLSVISSPREFEVHILLIPIEYLGYSNIQVELQRNY